MTKRIAIDCRFAADLGGLGRYTRELVPRLVALSPELSWVLLVKRSNEVWLKNLPSTVEIIEIKAEHYSLAEQFEVRRALKKSKSGLLFSLHFNVPFFCPVPFVATIHDLILHRYPNQASLVKQVGYRIIMRRTVRRARELIVISEFTKYELLNFYGRLARKKITLIYEGVDKIFQPVSVEKQSQARQKYGLQKPFFLYIGNAKQHKNVQTLIDAFASLQSNTQELLLITGGKELAALQVKNGIRVVNEVSNEDLPALLSASLALVTASLYEGFGLPVAEAIATGAKVIAVDGSSIPEAAQGQAYLVEPTVEAFAAAMRNVAQLPSPTSKTTFSWEATAAKTADLLRETV